MATFAVAVTEKTKVGNSILVTGTITPTGNYTTSGGDSLDLAGLTGMGSKAPKFVVIQGLLGKMYIYDHVNKKLKIFWSGTASAVLNEHSASAIGENPNFFAFF